MARSSHLLSTGRKMVESKPILWINPGYQEMLSCFIGGCRRSAMHLVKIRYGDGIIQVCLCDECRRKSTKIILHGLALGSERAVN